MKIKIKKLQPDAVIPKYAKSGDAGLDLTAISEQSIDGNGVFYTEYGTGLAVEIPQGYVGLIFPRSSIYKTGFILSNSVGVIDSGYRGEIKFKFYDSIQMNDKPYVIGDRIGQLIVIPYPQVEFEETQELSETERGSGGFGSTNANITNLN